MSVSWVFFDAGETLLRPEPSFPELAAKVIRERGHPVTGEDIIAAGRMVSHHFQRAAEEGRVFSASAEDSHDFWTTLYTEMLAELRIEDRDAPEVLYATFSDPSNYGLFPDAEACVRHLSDRGYRLGVISNFEGWLEGLLDRLGIIERFDVLAISGPLGWEKPDPRIFRWALDEAGAQPAEAAHVGDQPYFDAAAATACGMHGILLDRYDRWREEDHPRIAGLDELPDLVEELGR